VSEVVVVGAPDPAGGETVVAVLEWDGTMASTLAEVRERAELPHTAAGKVDRCAVKALAAAEAEV
jgi:acyl-CoA synthetase (AMP-forming)/AMP-acid ligase II